MLESWGPPGSSGVLFGSSPHPKMFVQKRRFRAFICRRLFARQTLTIPRCLACEREARDLDGATSRRLARRGTGPERRPHAPGGSPAAEPDGYPDHISAADRLPRTPSAVERKEWPESGPSPDRRPADGRRERSCLRSRFKGVRSVT